MSVVKNPLPNPSKRKVRPSTAPSNIQTHPSYQTGLYHNKARPVTAAFSDTSRPSLAGGLRPKTQASGPRQNWRLKKKTNEQTQTGQKARRLTVGGVDGIANTSAANRPPHIFIQAGDLLKGRIEELINIETLEKLSQTFRRADEDGSGGLELDEFKKLLRTQLHIPTNKEGQIDALFQKIDWSSEGTISWDEFCTYMQLEYAEKEDSYVRGKEVCLHLPAKIVNSPHREAVVRISDTIDGTFVVCSQDGSVSFWTSTLELKRSRTVVQSENPRSKPKWITDFVIMNQFNKFLVGTGDREIQFFELSSFEPYCQISGLETIPLKIDYCATGQDECLIIWGDSEGCINIIVISAAGECLRTWKKMPKRDGIASVSIEVVAKNSNTHFLRWKVHEDWVQQVKYYHDLRQVISCSNHANTALVIGCTSGSTHIENQLKEIRDRAFAQQQQKKREEYNVKSERRSPSDENVFKVYKGVKTFDFSKRKNVLITGGMDRLLRMWNPYVSSKPSALLRGHSAPIVHAFIAEEEGRIFSISTDKCVKIWDISDQNCLLTVRAKGHKIRGDIQSCYYSPVAKALCIATDQMNSLLLKLRPQHHADIPVTHKEPIYAIVYNPNFKQIITSSESSVIKVWDIETGNAIFEYGDAHGDSAITALAFDNTSRRLLSAGRDGCVRIWNYNNGHCLRTLRREDEAEELCSLAYVEMNRNRYVIGVGWDKRINIFSDSSDDAKVRLVQHQQPHWKDDLINGHKDDILCVAQCKSNLIATSSYDGQVIVWNMVSGHRFCNLVADPPPEYENNCETKYTINELRESGQLSVNKVCFLSSRFDMKESALVVSSGPCGFLHFWNIYHGGKVAARFSSVKSHESLITAMCVDKSDKLVIVGDSNGFIYQWNIENYCLNGPEENVAELLLNWRAHIECITNVVLVDEQKIIISSSLDCTVRVWTLEAGDYVGTFGQLENWNIYQPSTYQHPMVPYDVLVDPMSLPTHPVIKDKENMAEVVHADSAREDKEKRERELQAFIQYTKQQFYVDDDTIAEQLKTREYASGTGKRLRHEKFKPLRIERGGPSEYQALRTYKMATDPSATFTKKLTEAKDSLESLAEEVLTSQTAH